MSVRVSHLNASLAVITFAERVQEPSTNLAIHLAQVSVKYHNTTPNLMATTCKTTSIYESPPTAVQVQIQVQV